MIVMMIPGEFTRVNISLLISNSVLLFVTSTCIRLSLSVSVSASVSVCVSRSLSLSVSLCLSLSVSLSVSVYLCLSLSLSISVSVSLSLSHVHSSDSEQSLSSSEEDPSEDEKELKDEIPRKGREMLKSFLFFISVEDLIGVIVSTKFNQDDTDSEEDEQVIYTCTCISELIMGFEYGWEKGSNPHSFAAHSKLNFYL